MKAPNTYKSHHMKFIHIFTEQTIDIKKILRRAELERKKFTNNCLSFLNASKMESVKIILNWSVRVRLNKFKYVFFLYKFWKIKNLALNVNLFIDKIVHPSRFGQIK